MKKNLVAASAVVLGLALSGAALAGGPVADTGFNHTGLYTGLATADDWLDGFNVGFSTDAYSVGTGLYGDYDKDLGFNLEVNPYFMMHKALAPRWTFDYGVSGEVDIYGDKAKYGLDQTPFQVGGSLGLSYAWGKHTELWVGMDVVSFVKPGLSTANDDWTFFDNITGGINYFFS